MEIEWIYCRMGTGAISNTKQQSWETGLADSVLHCIDISSTGMSEAKLVVRVPFANMLESEFPVEFIADQLQISLVLYKRCGIMLRISSRPNYIHHNRNTRRSPISKYLSSGLDVRIVKDTS